MKTVTSWVRVASLALAFGALVLAPSSSASFPGANGKIAFVRDDQGYRQIFTVQSDGSGLVKLSKSGGHDRSPSWSGDGKRIAFSSVRRGNQTQIWVMDANGGGKKNVSNSGYLDYAPAFSPDGKKIAFVRRVVASGQIWVMNADGSGQKPLTSPPPGYADEKPSWSPDGTHIAFQRCCFPAAQIFTMLADGSGQTNVSGAPGATGDDGPDWSPDGTRIVFGRYHAELSSSDAYVMNADGSNQTRLTVGLGVVNPKWSPDGARIALEATYQGVRAIYSVTSTGVAGVTMIAEGFNPAWQPVP